MKGKGKVIFPSLHSAKGCPGGSVVKSALPMQERWAEPLGWEDPPAEGNDNPLQYSCLGNPMDREAWQSTVHGGAKSQIGRAHV